ncbi:MAG: spermidine synthase [Myxococcaceae bacterium]|nr:spermidine synthase [Myxococcaceae bacterium]
MIALRAEATKEHLLLGNVLVVAVCALVYELLCGTLASYLLGDAVLQFSLVLGTYLFAMGVGAWLSKSLEARAASRYVQTELALALVGGLSVPLLLAGVAAHVPLRPALYTVVFLVGALVGVELPLLVKILRSRTASNAESDHGGAHASFGDVVARALAYDYVGALAASLLFPLLLVPRLGLVKTSVAAGAVNAVVALSATFVVRVERPGIVRVVGVGVLLVLAVTFVRGEAWVASATD